MEAGTNFLPPPQPSPQGGGGRRDFLGGVDMKMMPGAGDVADVVLSELAQSLVDRIIERTADGLKSMRLIDWGRHLLPGYFRLPPSKMHQWLSDELDALADCRGTRLNALGPRGSAKSTLGTLACVLRSAVHGEEPYIWIVSDTHSQAKTHLAHVKAELEQNLLLQAYYPKSTGQGRQWRSDAIELANGTVIEAYGTGQHLRGRRRRQHRPSLIVCDDLQNDEHIASAMRREASRDWFHSALAKAGDRNTNIVNFATALHRDALGMELARSPGWRSRVFRAIETWPERMDLWAEWEDYYLDVEDAEAAGMAREFFLENRAAMEAGAVLLWPEHEDLYQLMRMRVDEGRTQFEREKQNSPLDPAKCEWPEEYFGHHIWFQEWPEELVVRTVALDPSKGADARSGDYSAYVMVGIDRHGLYHVEADLERRPTTQMAYDGALFCKRFNPQAFGVETSLLHELLAKEFKAAFREIHAKNYLTHEIKNSVSKPVRIRRLGPLLAQRRLRFYGKSKGTKLLVEQLRNFPQGAHDDGPDALEMAVRLAEELIGGRSDDGLGGRLIAG